MVSRGQGQSDHPFSLHLTQVEPPKNVVEPPDIPPDVGNCSQLRLPSLRHTIICSQGKVDLHYQGSSALLGQTKQEIYTSKPLAWHCSNQHQVPIQAVTKITCQTQRTTLRLRETLLSCFSEEHHDSKH